MRGPRQIVAAISNVTLLSVLGRAPGLALPFLVAAISGVTPETDAFFIAFTVAMFVTTMFTSASEAVVVPYLAPSGGGAFRTRLTMVIRSAIPVLAIVTLAFAGAAPLIVVRVTALPANVHDFATAMLRWLSLLVVLAGIASVLGGALNAKGAFSLPAVSPGIRTGVALLLGALLIPSAGLQILVVGLVAGEFLRLAVLGWRVTTVIEPAVQGRADADTVGPFFRQAAWQMLAMIVLSATPLINRVVATFMGVGSVSVLEYAEKLWFVPVTLMTTGIGPVLLTHWVDKSYVAGSEALDSSLRSAAIIVLAGGCVMALLGTIFSSQAVRLVLGHGVFPAAELEMVSKLLKVYMLSLPTYVLNSVIAQAHIATGNTKALLWAAVVRTGAHLLGLWAMLGPLGIVAIPAAQAIATLCSVGVLWGTFKRRRGRYA